MTWLFGQYLTIWQFTRNKNGPIAYTKMPVSKFCHTHRKFYKKNCQRQIWTNLVALALRARRLDTSKNCVSLSNRSRVKSSCCFCCCCWCDGWKWQKTIFLSLSCVRFRQNICTHIHKKTRFWVGGLFEGGNLLTLWGELTLYPITY